MGAPELPMPPKTANGLPGTVSQTSSPPGSTSPWMRAASASASSFERRADDQVAPAPLDGEAFLLEPVGEVARVAVRGHPDADLPGGVAALERLLLPRLGGRLVAPAVLRRRASARRGL